MSNSENQIGIVENVNNYFDIFTLYWMETRLVAIRTGPLESVGVWNAYIERMKGEQLKGLTLDEIFVNDRKSFALRYFDMKEVKLVNLDSGWKKWKKPQLDIDTEKTHVTFYLDKSHVEKLKEILSKIQRKIGIPESFY
jgi:hypothetical protein